MKYHSRNSAVLHDCKTIVAAKHICDSDFENYCGYTNPLLTLCSVQQPLPLLWFIFFFVVVFKLLEIMEQRTTALYADSRLYLQRWNEWWENVLSSFANWVCLMEMSTWEPACRGCNGLWLLFIQSLFWLLASPGVMMSPKTRFGSGNGKACMVQLYKTRSFPICAAVFSGTCTVS